MASTLLNEQGFPPDVIELQLPHSERNKVRAVYNKAQRLLERREMMQAWADYLDALMERRELPKLSTPCGNAHFPSLAARESPHTQSRSAPVPSIWRLTNTKRALQCHLSGFSRQSLMRKSRQWWPCWMPTRYRVSCVAEVSGDCSPVHR